MELALLQKLRHGALRRVLRERGWNQRQLADYLGVPQGTVSNWMTFKSVPRDAEVQRQLMELTGVHIDDLFPPGLVKTMRDVPLEQEDIREVPLRQLEGALRRQLAPSPEAQMLTEEPRHLIARAVTSTLSPKEQRVINYRFGLDGDEHTLAETGHNFGVSQERIRQIEAQALRKLKHPGALKRTGLLDLVEGETRRHRERQTHDRPWPLRQGATRHLPPVKWYCYCHGWQERPGHVPFHVAWTRLHPVPILAWHPAQVAAAGGRTRP